MQHPDDINNNFDFQKELLELLSTEDTVNDNVCLISNLPLENNCIKLACGHKFNYCSIFNEIKYQKNPNHLETQKLYTSEIKCPYCRTVQKGLLPSRDNFQNIIGVNWPKKYQYKPNKCKYTYLSGKRKGTSCGKNCFNKYCDAHNKIMLKRENKQLIKEKKQLEKEQQNLLKQLTNAKQNIKIKEEKTGIPTCHWLYKRGKKKGMRCSCKKPFPSPPMDLINTPWYCKAHHKLVFKQENKIINTINNTTQNVVITV
tara:strand:- start:386 stop:1156 length:771 start_codon:yes stop_codon:yes gene_type:complete